MPSLQLSPALWHLLNGSLTKLLSRVMETNTSQNDMPVVTVNQQLACENSKFFVYLNHVIDQAGFEVPNYLVVAPKQTGANLLTGIAILPVIEDKVGLLRIYRPALGSFSWEIPHGFVDEGEVSQTAAARELREETGLTCSPADLTSLGFFTPDTGVLAARVELFVARKQIIRATPEGELGIREFRLFTIPEFERMILNSEVQDSFTLAAWCKYRLMRDGI